MLKRKIFVILSVVFILGLCVVPAFAFGVNDTPGSELEYGYAPVAFDEIRTAHGSFTWPYNSTVNGSSDTFAFYQGEIDDGKLVAWGDIGLFDAEPAYVRGSFSASDFASSLNVNNQFSLVSEGVQILSYLALSSFVMTPGAGVEVTSYMIDVTVITPTQGHMPTDAQAPAWVLGGDRRSAVFYPDSRGVLNLGESMQSLFKFGQGGGWCMIKDLTITVEFSRTDVSTPYFNIAYEAEYDPPDDDFIFWSHSYPMPMNVEVVDPDTNFMTWLFRVADGFLDVELMPGLDFRAVLYGVLSILVVVAFLHLMG